MRSIKIPYPHHLRTWNFIAFEGLDGSGKSTQLNLLQQRIAASGKTTRQLKEPTDLETGKRLRTKIEHSQDLTPLQALDLFLEDRQMDVNKNILPSLAQGQMVLIDRYLFSNAAYQGIQLTIDEVLRQNIQKGFPMPSMTFFFDLTPDQCLERISLRGDPKTLFEKRETLTLVHRNFMNIAAWDDSFIIINADQNIQDIHDQVWQEFQKKEAYNGPKKESTK